MNQKLTRYGQEIAVLSGRYRLERRLGRGGMGEVWLALDTRGQRQYVAVKVINEDEDQSSVDHFLKENRLAASLKHPHILRVEEQLGLHALGGGKGMLPYIVMEYAGRGDLRRRLKDNVPYDIAEALSITAQIGLALQCAHEHGLLHRDVKPHNILFRRLADGGEQAVLSDFGIAVALDTSRDSFARHGTPAYMALEHMQGHAEARSDLYSLAVVLYQLLTGQLPDRFSPLAPSTLNPLVPPTLDPIILSALALNLSDRPTTVAAFLEDLRTNAGRVIRRDVLQQSAPSPTDHPTGRGNRRDVLEQSALTGLDAAGKALTSSGRIAQAHPYGSPEKPESPLKTSNNPNSPPTPNTEPGIITLGGPKTARETIPPLVSIPTRILPPPTTPARHRSRRGLIAAILIVITLLLIGAIALAAPGLLKGGPAYSVSITPASQKGNDTYVVTAVTGTPDASALQVQATNLTGQAQSQPQPVNATGRKQTAATYAKGFLTFYNSNTFAYTVARNVITASNGVKVENDSAVTIPAGDAAAPSTKSVAATAVAPGTNGNIAAGAVAGGCCANGIAVQNLDAFTGGQDAQSYTVVAQSDIDGVSNPAIPGLTTQAQQAMNAKLTKNLRYAGQGTCTPTVNSDHQAGEKATSVTVTVTVNCQREAYDVSQIPAVVTTYLQNIMSTKLGPGFHLYKIVDAQGNQTSLATVNAITNKGVDPQTHTVTLDVAFKSLWVYQIPEQQQKDLKAHIAGETVAQALTYLKSQPGVSDASIQPNSGTLPTDVGQIGLSVVR